MDKRKQAAKYGRLIHEKGLVIGAGGNISVKDGNFLIIKKQGADMSNENVNDYVRVSFDKVEHEKESLSSEIPLHLACYESGENIGAVVHVHPPLIIAASEKADLLESTSYEFDCVLQRSVPVIEYIQSGSFSLAAAIADKLRDGATVVMMRRHGAVSVGKDLEEAYLRILALERACMTFLYR